jgi:hypothetical protein
MFQRPTQLPLLPSGVKHPRRIDAVDCDSTLEAQRARQSDTDISRLLVVGVNDIGSHFHCKGFQTLCNLSVDKRSSSDSQQVPGQVEVTEFMHSDAETLESGAVNASALVTGRTGYCYGIHNRDGDLAASVTQSNGLI